jgi:hypothetical protein
LRDPPGHLLNGSVARAICMASPSTGPASAILSFIIHGRRSPVINHRMTDQEGNEIFR